MREIQKSEIEKKKIKEKKFLMRKSKKRDFTTKELLHAFFSI